MTCTELGERLALPLGAKEADLLADETCSERLQHELLNYASASGGSVAFHAAWVLEKSCRRWGFISDSERNRFFSIFCQTLHPGVRRHFLNLMLVYYRHVQLPQLEHVAWVVTDWLTDKSSKPAVKASALELLWCIAPNFEWLQKLYPELEQEQLNTSTAAIAARVRKIRRTPIK